MIIGFLVNLFSTVIIWLINFLPDQGTGLGSAVNTGIQQLGAYLHTYDYFFPVGLAISLALTSLGIEVGLWLAYFVFWVIKTIADVLP